MRATGLLSVDSHSETVNVLGILPSGWLVTAVTAVNSNWSTYKGENGIVGRIRARKLDKSKTSHFS